MRILFLDFDGPMIPHRSKILPGNNASGFWPSQFDPVTSCWLEAILQASGARLVISSTWRREGRDFIERMLAVNCISPGHLHEDWSTARINRVRDEEIREWLSRHNDVDDFIVIDDEESISSFGDHAVLVDYDDGMRMSHFRAICTRFEIQIEERRGVPVLTAWTPEISDVAAVHERLMSGSKDARLADDPLGYPLRSALDRVRAMASDDVAGINADAVEHEADPFIERLKAAGKLPLRS
jgi:hypothetical protein